MAPTERLCEPTTGSPLTCPTGPGGTGQSPAPAAPVESPTAVPTVPGSTGTGDGGFLTGLGSLLPWLLCAVLLITAVVLLMLLIRAHRRLRRRPASVAPAPAGTASGRSPAASAPPAADGPADPRRDQLIDDLLTLADLATAPAVAAQTERVLRRLGVEAIDARPGDVFDPDLHAAAATAPTRDPAQQQRVASQVRRGWRTGGAVLRPADVAVWLHSPADPPAD